MRTNIPNVDRHCQIALQKSWICLHSQKQWMKSAYFLITLWSLGITKLSFVCQSDTQQMEFGCYVMHVLNCERGEDLSHVYELFLFLKDCSYPLPAWWSAYESRCLKPCLVSHETIYWYNSMNFFFAQVWASTNQRELSGPESSNKHLLLELRSTGATPCFLCNHHPPKETPYLLAITLYSLFLSTPGHHWSFYVCKFAYFGHFI